MKTRLSERNQSQNVTSRAFLSIKYPESENPSRQNIVKGCHQLGGRAQAFTFEVTHSTSVSPGAVLLASGAQHPRAVFRLSEPALPEGSARGSTAQPRCPQCPSSLLLKCGFSGSQSLVVAPGVWFPVCLPSCLSSCCVS